MTGLYALVVLMDNEGAFDNLSFSAIRKALREHGCDRDIEEWYGYLLENRIVTAELNGCTATRRPTKGTPQGGILSPLAWNLVANTLYKEMDLGPSNVIKYADDDALIVPGRIPADMVQQA